MEVLLEIGIEEIPARFLRPAIEGLKKLASEELDKKRITYQSVKTYGTPRRLIAIFKDVNIKQDDLNEQNIGPSKKVAFTVNGEPSKAAMGFAKSQGVDVVDLMIVKTEKGEYIAAEQFKKGQETIELLPEVLESIIKKLTFPKSMRWGEGKFKFVRPIQNILALCDEELIDIEIADIKSSRTVYGHRFFGEKSFEIENITNYFYKLKSNYVVIDIDERKQMIEETIETKVKKIGETVLYDDKLLEEVANLVEYPYPIVGTFNAEFLEVPQEVLIITMQVHQRYFPVVDSDGNLLPKFIVIRNGIEFSENVKEGNEKVLIARLSDARFFYYEDLKLKLDDLTEKLKGVVFQKDLGTIFEKVERIKELSNNICDYLDIEKEKEHVIRTAHLAKSDLVSNMISEKEYTKLQGFMGKKYAEKAGENQQVADGIYEHYLPKFQGDKLPTTNEGIVVSIADKIDTICGCFCVGITPSGSQDPFALRRAALGIVSILIDKKLDISLYDIINTSLEIYKRHGILKRDIEVLEKEIFDFFKQRVIYVLSNSGYRKDIVEAVVMNDFENLLDTQLKIETLQKISKQDGFDDILKLIKRVKNITKDYEEKDIDKDLINLPEEKDLYSYLQQIEKSSKVNYIEKNYDKIFMGILAGQKIIDPFFDNVMVMDKDPKIKENRISILKRLDKIFNEIAIISHINS